MKIRACARPLSLELPQDLALGEGPKKLIL